MALPENWHHLSHDYSSENTNEDPRMMAFFDSLIQQEIEEWESNSSTDLSEQEDRSISSFFSCNSTSSSSSESSNSSNTSNSSSTSASGSSSGNNVSLGERRNRSKRHSIIRKKKQKKIQSNKVTKLAKTKLNQLQLNQLKPTNRIAYLIAKKRNTLRRLAIKGASLNNRRLNKRAVGTNGNIHKMKSKQNHHPRPIKRRQVRLSSNGLKNEKPTTSGAALSAGSRSFVGNEMHKKAVKKSGMLQHFQRAKCVIFLNKIFSNFLDRKCSSDEDSGNFAVTGSSPFTTKPSCSSNTNVPSTSTGITSNFRGKRKLFLFEYLAIATPQN